MSLSGSGNGKDHSGMRRCRRSLIAGLLAGAMLWVSSPAHAARPYEAVIGGVMSAILQTLITGEFAGRSPSNADAALNRPICKPEDYDDLRAAANDRVAFDAFRRRCKLVEGTKDDTHVHSTAYLPNGYCELLKAAFETILAEHIHHDPMEPTYLTRELIIEYKGSRYASTDRQLARWAQLKATCLDDGALRISAPRKRPLRA
jgi:hypothetical protein